MRPWMFFLIAAAPPALAQEPADDEHLVLNEGAEPTEAPTPPTSVCETACRDTHTECRAACLHLAPGTPGDLDFREEVEVCAVPCGEAASACLAGCQAP